LDLKVELRILVHHFFGGGGLLSKGHALHLLQSGKGGAALPEGTGQGEVGQVDEPKDPSHEKVMFGEPHFD